MTAKQLRAAIVELGGIPRGTKITGDDGLRAQYESWLESSSQVEKVSDTPEAPLPAENSEGDNNLPVEPEEGVVTFEDDTTATVVIPPATPVVAAPVAEVKKGKIPITKVKIPGSKFVRVIKGMSPDEGGSAEAKRRWGSKVEILN